MKNHTTLKAKFNSAFSLVEFLVVIAVIAVIAAIAIPNITGAREAEKASAVAANADPLASIVAEAVKAGAVDSTGKAPTLEGLTAGTVYTTPAGVVFSKDSVKPVGQ